MGEIFTIKEKTKDPGSGVITIDENGEEWFHYWTWFKGDTHHIPSALEKLKDENKALLLTDDRPWVRIIASKFIKGDILTYKDKAKEMNIKYIPPLTGEQKKEKETLEANSTVAICGQCGIEVKQVMNYSYDKKECPVFLKPDY